MLAVLCDVCPVKRVFTGVKERCGGELLLAVLCDVCPGRRVSRRSTQPVPRDPGP